MTRRTAPPPAPTDDPVSAPGVDPPAPTVTLRFAGPGAADCSIELAQVTPGQVMAAAWFLDAYARELRAQALAAAPQPVRSMPAPAALAALRGR